MKKFLLLLSISIGALSHQSVAFSKDYRLACEYTDYKIEANLNTMKAIVWEVNGSSMNEVLDMNVPVTKFLKIANNDIGYEHEKGIHVEIEFARYGSIKTDLVGKNTDSEYFLPYFEGNGAWNHNKSLYIERSPVVNVKCFHIDR
jgi:hypothetical protein